MRLAQHLVIAGARKLAENNGKKMELLNET